MKNSIKTLLIDFLTGLIAIFLVFIVVRYIHPSNSSIVIYVAIIYIIAGLIRGKDKNIHLLLKLFIISLFGIIYIPLTGDKYSMMNIPYPVIAILFTLTGLIISKNWSSITQLRRGLFICLPIVTIILLSLFFFPKYFNNWKSHASGPASVFEMQTLDGEIINSSELKGKVILLDFWDTRCGPCIRLMPDMEKLYIKHKDNPNVAIYVVNAGWQSFEDAKTFASGHDFNLPYSYMDIEISKSMGVRELPTTIIIDKQFNYRLKHVGYDGYDPDKDKEPMKHFSNLIEQLLSEY